MSKEKLSVLDALVKQNLAKDLKSAKTLLSFGLVFLDNKKLGLNDKVFKNEMSFIRVLHNKKFVSRGAYKLETLFDKHEIDLSNKTCLDIGSSTGGFCQCLLSKGVEKIFAVDVGKNLMNEKLSSNSKILLFEGVNARYLDTYINKINNVDFCSIDVSFISLKKIVPALKNILKLNANLVCLFKPQFECEKNETKNGVLKDINIINRLLEDMKAFLSKNNYLVIDVIKSKIKGKTGNQEYLILSRKLV